MHAQNMSEDDQTRAKLEDGSWISLTITNAFFQLENQYTECKLKMTVYDRKTHELKKI